MSRRGSAPPLRDQHESAFTRILGELVERVPGARAAALVDQEGETVDYSGELVAYDLKVTAAHWRIVVDEIRAGNALSATGFVLLRAGRASFQAHVLPEGYALVLVLARGAGFGGWRRAVSACTLALGAEASWPPAALRLPRWAAVKVVADARRRPLVLGTAAAHVSIEILGVLATGLTSSERGWRVRLRNGLEGTLVREPGGHWYIDDPQAAEHVRTLASPGK